MTKIRLFLANLAVGLLVIAVLGGNARAQVLYGSLTGEVTDQSSAVVPGAKVEALNVGTGVLRQATTDERGVYIFTNLQPGTYKVTVSANSFKTVIEGNVIVNANEIRRVDRAMQIASTSETVEV